MLLNIKEIEIRHKDKLESLEEWNYLRNYYRTINENNKNIRHINKLQAFKDIFYGFFSWFRHYDYLVFSDSSERKKINGRLYDIKLDSIIEHLGTNNTLLVETPVPLHYKESIVYTKNIVSRRIIDLLTLAIEKICFKTDNIFLLEKINQKFGLNYNYKKSTCRFKTQYKIYKFLFKIMKPRKIFLNCYYDKQYIIKAAYDLGIKVIEVQHGLISKSHTAYYSTLTLNKDYLPNYLLSFGEILQKEKDTEFIFNLENIYPIGSFYLNYIKTNFQKELKLFNTVSGYKLTVGVSLQWTVENELIFFLKNISSSLSDILFILIPRSWDEKKYQNLNLPSNMIFYPKLNCYQIILHCNYHCTVYSSCALEAPTLGIPNILINLKDFTKKYISNMSKDNTYIVNTEQEFIERLQQEYTYTRDEVIKSNKEQFVNNDNLKKIINKLKVKNDK